MGLVIQFLDQLIRPTSVVDLVDTRGHDVRDEFAVLQMMMQVHPKRGHASLYTLLQKEKNKINLSGSTPDVPHVIGFSTSLICG